MNHSPHLLALTDRHFRWIILAAITWLGFLCLPGMRAPVGNYWWDYFALKGLEYQIFSGQNQLDQLWLPFILPVLLLKIANVVSGFGVDYLVAHGIIALATLLFSYHAVYRSISERWRTPVYWLVLLFSIWPVVLDEKMLQSFKDAIAIVYCGFYNRYLDVIFCLLLISFSTHKNKNPTPKAVYWCYALIIALLSKLSYFFVFFALIWAHAVVSKDRSAYIACVVGAASTLGLYLMIPNYFDTVWEIAQVRGVPLSLQQASLLAAVCLPLSWLALFIPQSWRLSLFIPLPIMTAYIVGAGNYGDLSTLRMVTAVIVTLQLLKQPFKDIDFFCGYTSASGTRTLKIDWSIAGSCAALLFLLNPIAALLKTGTVTSYAMVTDHWKKDNQLIEFRNIPGFFSHEKLIEQVAIEKIPQVANLSLDWFKPSRRHTITYFTLYAMNVDSVLDRLALKPQSKIAWYSYPGMVPQLLGIGRIPEQSRPWYLYKHEIDERHHPDFAAISRDSDIVIFDDCVWSDRGEIKSAFQLEQYITGGELFQIGCFRGYANN